MKWTPEQEAAISTRGCNLLVAAAAGAGKTSVLVERIIRRLTDPRDPIDVDSLLVVTFTRSAAAEMRTRIGEALGLALNENPTSERLRRQLVLLNRAAISTLHAFCGDMLRRYFFRLDLDPEFQVMDEHEAALLRREVLDAVFEARFAREPIDEGFIMLAEGYGGEGGDSRLQDLVLQVHAFASTQLRPHGWLDAAVGRFLPGAAGPMAGDGLEGLPWLDPLLAEMALQLSRSVTRLERALTLAQSPGGPGRYADRLAAELVMMRSLEEIVLGVRAGGGVSWTGMAAAFADAEFGSLPRAGAEVDDRLKERVQKLRDEAKKCLQGLRQDYFSRPAAGFLADLVAVASPMKALARLVKDFDQAYRAAKEAAGRVDYADLERMCLELLVEPGPGEGPPVPSALAQELRDRYNEVLVDEYQDINPVQDAILHLVSRQNCPGRSPNLFMVGDVKQSIYRFRLAEPRLFLDKHRAFPAWRPDAEVQPGGQRIDLSANFRSRRGVVAAVNFLFRQLMTPGVGEMAYDRAAELVYGASYPASPGGEDGHQVELHLVERKVEAEEPDVGSGGDEGGELGSSVDPGQALEELEAVEREALVVAQRIRSMVGGGLDSHPGKDAEFHVWDREEKCYRPVEYRDIVVLMRALRHQAGPMLRIFQQAGIPAYAEVGSGFLGAVEVETMVSLLRIIDNPRQDIHLVGVLRSPLVGLNSSDLARIRLVRRQGDFYGAATAAASQLAAGTQAGLGLRLERFLKLLNGWRTAARRGPLGALVWQIYRETGYLDFAGGLPGGAQRQANLRALHDRARQFDQFSRQGLARFLRFLDQLRRTERDLGPARPLGEKENVVRVMSIHASKGLEFPVVFVAGLGGRFHRGDSSGDLLFHRDLLLGPRLVDTRRRLKYPTIAHRAIGLKSRQESLAEEMRLLYVALTRAREKLVLVGSAADLNARCRVWGEQASHGEPVLADADLAGARCFLDWICPAVARHRDGAAIGNPGTPAVTGPVGDDSRWQVIRWGSPATPATSATPATLATGDTRPLPLAVLAGAAGGDGRRLLAQVSKLEPLGATVTPELQQTLSERFRWGYPYRALAGLRAKMTVSEAKRYFDVFREEHEARPPSQPLCRRPRFLAAAGELTAAELGTATHLVLQHLDLDGPLDLEDIKQQLAALVRQELLTPEAATAVGTHQAEYLVRFFASPLGRRLQANRLRVWREIPFSLGVSLTELGDRLPPEIAARGGADRVLVQGMIDCLLAAPWGLVLIDFKTDRVGLDEVKEAAGRYHTQMRLYAQAVNTIFRQRVAETWLVFLTPGENIPLDLQTE